MITFIDVILVLILWMLAIIVSRLTQISKILVDNNWPTNTFWLAYLKIFINDLGQMIEDRQDKKVIIKINKKTNGPKTPSVSGN